MKGFFSAGRVPAVLVGLVTVGFAGCLESEGPIADLRAQFEGRFKDVEGVLTFDEAMLEGRFVNGGEAAEWSDAPVFQSEAPKVVVQKRDPGMTGGGGTLRHLYPELENTTIEFRIKDSELFEGYTIGWGTRLGNPRGAPQFTFFNPFFQQAVVREECNQINLNARTDVLWNEPFVFRPNSAGLYVVQAEVLYHGERIAIFCTPIVAMVNAHWTAESTIYPVGADAAAGPSTPDFEKMTDEFPFDVGQAYYRFGAKIYRGQLLIQLRYRGTWEPTKGGFADLSVLEPEARGAGCAFFNLQNPPKGPGEFVNQDYNRAVNTNGIWVARVGARPSCNFFLPSVYPNLGPVPYSLDVTLTYA